MIKIKELIMSERIVLDKSKLLDTLDSTSISLKNKLVFLPFIAHFVMNFGDFNKYVLPFKAPTNELENLVNIHAAEDAEHWIWYVHDLEKLSYDLPEKFTTTLKKLWSKENEENQILFFELVHLVHNQPANIRLAIIEAIEITGHIIFSKLRDITQHSNYQLSYCGDIHYHKETGHTIGAEEKIIDQLTFSTYESEIAIQSIKQVFKAFSRWYQYLDFLICTHHRS